MPDRLTIEQLAELLEKAMPADRHSREIKLGNGAVWRLERIKVADQ